MATIEETRNDVQRAWQITTRRGSSKARGISTIGPPLEEANGGALHTMTANGFQRWRTGQAAFRAPSGIEYKRYG